MSIIFWRYVFVIVLYILLAMPAVLISFVSIVIIGLMSDSIILGVLLGSSVGMLAVILPSKLFLNKLSNTRDTSHMSLKVLTFTLFISHLLFITYWLLK